MAKDPPELESLLAAAEADVPEAWHALLNAFGPRLRIVVAARIDPRLTGLVDPDDVIQETFAELLRRLPEFRRESSLPFFVWLRYLAGAQLSRLHRHHLGVQARDATRTVHDAMPDAASSVLTDLLMDKTPNVLDQVVRVERRRRVEGALSGLNPADREILVLRHFENLTAAEAGAILGISPAAASKRYLRALARFTDALRDMPGGLSGFLS